MESEEGDIPLGIGDEIVFENELEAFAPSWLHAPVLHEVPRECPLPERVLLLAPKPLDSDASSRDRARRLQWSGGGLRFGAARSGPTAA